MEDRILPDAPGYWWVEDGDGPPAVVHVWKSRPVGQLLVEIFGIDSNYNVDHEAFRWLGPVAAYEPARSPAVPHPALRRGRIPLNREDHPVGSVLLVDLNRSSADDPSVCEVRVDEWTESGVCKLAWLKGMAWFDTHVVIVPVVHTLSRGPGT